MVPLLEHYAFAGVLLTAVVLYALFYIGLAPRQPADHGAGAVVHADPGRRRRRSRRWSASSASTLAVGVRRRRAGERGLARPVPGPAGTCRRGRRRGARPIARAAALDRAAGHADRDAGLRSRADRSVVLPGSGHEDGGARPAGRRDRRPLGRARAGRLDADGGADRAAVWLGLSIWPSLWMLMLWLMAAALWTGSAMFGVRRTRLRPSFWSNALITALLLLGPAIEDSASGKSVLEGAVDARQPVRGVALYAWATIRLLERWRARRPRAARRRCTCIRRRRHDSHELPGRRAGRCCCASSCRSPSSSGASATALRHSTQARQRPALPASASGR